jgi:hypothetical protein
MSEFKMKKFESDFEDGIELHQRPNKGGMPVLLLHGASARHETFVIPGPDMDGKPRCLRDWLWEEGFEPWLLDWRGSATVVEKAGKDRLREFFDLDHAADRDIPWALEKIREVSGDERGIGAVGHCLGAGALAQAIAGGSVTGEAKPRLTHVVLLTLGLFYRPPFEGRLKTQERSLERLWNAPEEVATVDPRPGATWPGLIEEIYRNWPGILLPHSNEIPSEVFEMCNRLSFMYGPPYLEKQLVPEIHRETWTVSFHKGASAPLVGQVVEGERSGARGKLHEFERTTGAWAEGDAAGVLWLVEANGKFESDENLKVGKTFIASSVGTRHDAAQLPAQFGAIPLRMFFQAAKNVLRQGRAGRFEDPPEHKGLTCDVNREHFDGLAMTLITGRENKLWLSRGVDDMYEWLKNGPQKPGRRCRKVVLRGYGHQDLLWGRSAREDVFPKIREGLR